GRRQTPVIPGQSHGRHLTATWKVEVYDAGLRIGFGVAIGRAGLDAGGRLQLQHAKNGIETVAAHVAESAATEIVPAAPNEGQVSAAEGTLRRRPEPQIPIQSVRHGIVCFGPVETLRPEGTA